MSDSIKKYEELKEEGRFDTLPERKHLDLKTLLYVKQIFEIHSDWSTQCNGYRSLVSLIKERGGNTELGNNANLLLCAGLNESANVIFQNNKEKGFWDNDRNVGELLMLVTSELGEAMEAHRKGRFANLKQYYEISEKEWADKSPIEKREKYCFEKLVKDTFEDEIADAVIRLLDLSAGLGIDLEKHINEKVKYNKLRERLHGKQY